MSSLNEVIVVVVNQESFSRKPYQYKGISYKRLGNTTRTMSSEKSKRILIESVHSEHRWGKPTRKRLDG